MDTTQTATHIGLCAGYGGIELGLGRVWPSLFTVAYSEIEAFACANLVAKIEAGFLDVAPIWPDLKTFPWSSFRGKVDVLSGGYPCQPFSAAGNRAGSDDARHLWPFIADGIRILRPAIVFFENVEGHISLGLRDILRELEGCGYTATWGIFSAAEVGAPHQRKRVFILGVANDQCERAQELGRQIAGRSQFDSVGDAGGDAGGVEVTGGVFAEFPAGERSGSSDSQGEGASGESTGPDGDFWPSYPSEPQYGWEPPRVVANTIRVHGTGEGGEVRGRRGVCEVRESVGDSSSGGLGVGGDAPRSECGGHSDGSDEVLGKSARECSYGSGQSGQSGRRQFADAGGDRADADGGGGRKLARSIERAVSPGDGQETQADECSPESSVGMYTHECAGVLGETLICCPDGANAPDAKLSKKIRARQVLFNLWCAVASQAHEWTPRGLQCFLAEEVLISRVQLDGFPARVCHAVWCVQAGNEVKGWGLRGMWIYEVGRDSSQGSKPLEQFKRELGYAMCQLSYEIALERGQEAEETARIVQGMREASERAWALSEALPEMEEVWRSALDQEVWEKGCFVEATSTGSRTDELRLLGNGVVPATAAKAFVHLFRELVPS